MYSVQAKLVTAGSQILLSESHYLPDTGSIACLQCILLLSERGGCVQWYDKCPPPPNVSPITHHSIVYRGVCSRYVSRVYFVVEHILRCVSEVCMK